jgi:hypothetical protein
MLMHKFPGPSDHYLPLIVTGRVSERNVKKLLKNIIVIHKPKYNGTKLII